MHKSNHAIDAIDATHWSIHAQVPEEEQGDVVDVGFGKPGYRPGRFLDPTKSFLVTAQNDPDRGLLFCNLCRTERKPAIKGWNDGSKSYMCAECKRTDIRMITPPKGKWAIRV